MIANIRIVVKAVYSTTDSTIMPKILLEFSNWGENLRVSPISTWQIPPLGDQLNLVFFNFSFGKVKLVSCTWSREDHIKAPYVFCCILYLMLKCNYSPTNNCSKVKCSLCNGRILPTIPSFKFWNRESMKFERLSQIKDAQIDKKQSSFPPEQKSNHYRRCVKFSNMKFIFTKKCFYRVNYSSNNLF